MRSTRAPSVALYPIECTLLRGFDSFRARHQLGFKLTENGRSAEVDVQTRRKSCCGRSPADNSPRFLLTDGQTGMALGLRTQPPPAHVSAGIAIKPQRKMQRADPEWFSLAQITECNPRVRTNNSAAVNMPTSGAMK